MPGMNGDELVRALRDDPILARVPVVMNSAVATQPDSLSGVGYLRKPFSAHDFLHLLHAHAGYHDSRALGHTMWPRPLLARRPGRPQRRNSVVVRSYLRLLGCGFSDIAGGAQKSSLRANWAGCREMRRVLSAGLPPGSSAMAPNHGGGFRTQTRVKRLRQQLQKNIEIVVAVAAIELARHVRDCRTFAGRRSRTCNMGGTARQFGHIPSTTLIDPLRF